MKKLLSLFLAALMCLSLCILFASCDQEEKGTSNKGSGTEESASETAAPDTGLTKDEWKAMLSEANFENYTLTESQYITYDDVRMKNDAVIKVADDKTSVVLKVDDEYVDTLVYEGAEAAMQKKSYEQIYRALLAEFDHYTYDSANQAYKIEKQVTVVIPMELYNITATIVMNDATVKLSEDGTLLRFECDFTQTTQTPDGPATATAESIWTFSDYGTTVIAETAE